MTEALSVPVGVRYTVSYVPSVRTCKCGTKYRVDCADPGPAFAIQRFQHCEADDEGLDMIGSPLGVYEERGCKWVTVRLNGVDAA